MQKGYFQSEKEKNETHQQVLHIRVFLDSKFELQQKILNFWNNFPKQGHFQRKTEK